MFKKLYRIYSGLNDQAKVVFWFTFAGFLQRGISIITTPIFTRIMPKEEYGLFSVYIAYYGVIVIVSTMYLHMEVINNAFLKTDNTKERVVSVFQSLALVISASFFMVAFLLREQLSKLMHLPVPAVVIMFAAFMFVEPYHTWVIRKRYEFDYKYPVIASVLISVCTPIVSIIAVLLVPENQGIARIISFACANVIAPGLFFYINNYRLDHSFYDKKLWNYALAFNAPLIIHYLSETLLNQTDRIMINHFDGSGNVGVYSIAISVSTLFTIFSSALNSAFVPWTFQQIKEKGFEPIAKIGYMVLEFLALILSVMIIFGPEIVYILAGKEYMGAVSLIPTLSASTFFGYMYQLFSRFELYYEKKIYTVISTVTAAVVNILLNMWWIPKFGFHAAGYSTLLAHILFCVMHYLFFLKVCRDYIDGNRIYDIKKLLLISGGVLLVVALMTILYNYIYLRIAMVIILLIICFAVRRTLISLIKNLFAKEK